VKERQGDDAQHIEVEKKQLVWAMQKKGLTNCALRSLSDEESLLT